MKVVIIGGHFTPALAVIEALPKSAEILYIGRRYTFEKDKTVSLEYQTITKRGIRFIPLTTGRLQRSFSMQTLPSLAKIPQGLFQSIKILSEYKPDVVIGFGGYLSFPVCLAAYLLKIPFVIHEQTLHAGLSNKLLAQLATKICISWEESRRFFPSDKIILTGNPVLPLTQTMKKKEKESHIIPTIVVSGGSAGSHAINLLIEGCLSDLLARYYVIHQTGDAQEFGDYDRLSAMKKELPQGQQARYEVVKFIEPDTFVSLLEQADLVVGRSGINTVTMLRLLKKPSLLIPLPVGQHNEQYANAAMLQRIGLAEIEEQRSLTSKKLFDKIGFMLDNRKRYEILSEEKEQENSPLQAAEKIVTVLNDIAKKHSSTKEKSNF